MFFHCGTVVNDILFLFRKVAERDIGSNTHCSADIRHQRPHKRIPWGNGSFVNGEGLVRHECGFIYGSYHSGSIAGWACSLTVKGQLFGRWRIKFCTAFGADQFLSGCDGKCRSQIMPVWAAMTCQP